MLVTVMCSSVWSDSSILLWQSECCSEARTVDCTVHTVKGHYEWNYRKWRYGFMKKAERFWYPVICATFYQLQKSRPNNNVQVNNNGSSYNKTN